MSISFNQGCHFSLPEGVTDVHIYLAECLLNKKIIFRDELRE
jgi:hypothetical protein